MVYVRLAESLLLKVRQHVAPEKLLRCGDSHYIAYPELSTSWPTQSEWHWRTGCRCTGKSAGRTC